MDFSTDDLTFNDSDVMSAELAISAMSEYSRIAKTRVSSSWVDESSGEVRTAYLLQDGTSTMSGTEAWIQNPGGREYFRDYSIDWDITYDADFKTSSGTFALGVEAVDLDGNTTYYYILWNNKKKQPLAEYPVSDISESIGSIQSIFLSAENKICIEDAAGGNYSISPMKKYALIDYGEKMLYCTNPDVEEIVIDYDENPVDIA